MYPRKVAENIPQEVFRAPGMGFLQHRMTRPLQRLVRFGRWDELLQKFAEAERRGFWTPRSNSAHGLLQEAAG